MRERCAVVLNMDCVSIMEVRFSPLSTVAIMFTDAWQRHQVLLDPSCLWLQWFRIKTNIIIQLLYASYQEMLVSRWGGGQPEGNGILRHQHGRSCCLLFYSRVNILVTFQKKKMSALQCIQKCLLAQLPHSAHQNQPSRLQLQIYSICYLDTIYADFCYNEIWCHLVRLEKLGFLELSDCKKKSAYVSFTILSCESRTDLHVFNHEVDQYIMFLNMYLRKSQETWTRSDLLYGQRPGTPSNPGCILKQKTLFSQRPPS